MPSKRYKVTLSEEEQTFLFDLISKGKAAARKLARARIILKADQSQGEPWWSDQQISEALNVSCSTVERTRKTFVEEGIETALSRKRRCRPGNQKFDGQKEAHLIAIACSAAPQGRDRWTLQLLAEKMVRLNHFESISAEAVRQVLKKTNLSLG